MRSSIALAAFAAGALAMPFNQNEPITVFAKRDLVTAYNVVYATKVVTVTGSNEPKKTPAAEYYGHHNFRPKVEAPKPAPEPPKEEPTENYDTLVSPEEETEPPKEETEPPKEETEPPKEETEPSTPADYGATPTSYKEIVVFHHNIHRANHSVPDLEWDEELYSSAQEIASSCVYEHNTEVQGGGYGQNIAAGVEPGNVSAIITDLFYNGEEPLFAGLYGQDNPDMSQFTQWGHFTQIVWKSTTRVACATQHCPSGLGNTGGNVPPYFTVCNYKGPGNYAGEYAANVLEPLGHATADWSFGLSL